MNKAKIPLYQQKLDSYNKLLSTTQKKHTSVSWIRLLIFLALLLSWFYIITLNITVGILCGIGFTVAFAVLIKLHKKLEDKKAFLQRIIAINENEKACCNGKYDQFNSGDEFIDHGHPYSFDIDLFGKGSLFQFLNRTVSIKGKNLLAQWLKNTPLNNQHIISNQQSVKELSNALDFRQLFQTQGSLLSNIIDEEHLVNQWLNEPLFFKKRWLILFFLIIASTINISVITCVAFKILTWDAILYMILINLSIIGFKIKQFNSHYQILSKSHQVLKTLSQLISLIEKQTFTSPQLLELKSKLYKNDDAASSQIKKLTKLLDALDNRNNLLMGSILNALLFWDWHYLYRIENWKKNHELDFSDWINTIAHFDALISLANLAYNNPDFNFPSIETNNFQFSAQNLGHVLLAQEKRVCNDFSISETPRYAIVTGANMAGKSTFLRTIATNLVLAGCGSVVCADKMRFFPLKLHSSMRAEDSLMNNESYFFAELKRLQKITKALEKGEKLFIILDEILRGTNSEDKQKGSIGFVKKITEQLAYGLIATHDLELARLAEQNPSVFKALCFEVAFENNQLNFDYKLAPGVTQNMNASFLMKQMGIIDN